MPATEPQPPRRPVAVGRRFPKLGVMDAKVAPELPRDRPAKRPRR